MTLRIGLLAASTALLASAAQPQQPPPPQPFVTGSVDVRSGDEQSTGGLWDGAACQPTYPVAAVKAGAEGVTRLTLTIDTRGLIDAVAVTDSAGPTPAHKLLDQAGVQAAKDCATFTLRIGAEGQPVAYPATIEWRWSLHGTPPQAHPAQLRAIDDSCRPEYPPAAVRLLAQGETVLRMTIDAAGHVKAVRVLRSSGEKPEHKLLDQTASEALQRCPFTPGTDAAGLPVGTRVDVAYRWKLEP